ncbi:MAG: flagellar basal body L-ring protein FlgH [Gammaproteobacteria bacterium]
MKFGKFIGLTGLMILALSGCSSIPMQQQVVNESEPVVMIPEPPESVDGSIYQTGYGVALFEDVKARRVGDILTIVLSEQTNASKTAKTSTSKENDINIANPTLLGAPVAFSSSGTLQAQLDSAKTFSGEGDSEQSNELTGNLTVSVIKVLPNGYLKVEGEKQITINKGDEYVRISGIIRPIDIRSDNSVLSTQVANAKIAYGGKGVVADSNEMGWLARFFNGKWWPF